MILLTSYHLVVSRARCTKLMPGRLFSLFTERRSQVRVPWSFVHSHFLYVGGKEIEGVKLYPFTMAKRFLTTKARKHKKNLEVEVDKKGAEKTIEETTEKLVQSETTEIGKYLNKDTPIKENNLELFQELAQGDMKVFDQLRHFQMKIDIMSKMYGVAPKMTKEKWIMYLNLKLHHRKRYISYIFLNAIRKNKNEKRKPLYEVPSDTNNIVLDDPMCYHLFHNSMFLKIRTEALRRLNYSKLMGAILHAPEIFIDCSYDQYMSKFESKYLAKQIIHSMTLNIQSEQPYNLVLCNFDKNSNLGKSFTLYSPNFYEDFYPCIQTSKSYTDLYPREKLVYLSPHCNNNLDKIDPEKRYIIGGFVDKSVCKPISLAKAKENKISMAKFPLEVYLEWQLGRKNLCINHVFSIMLTLKNYNNDWERALKTIPSRFLIKAEERINRKKSSNVRKSVEELYSHSESSWESNLGIPDLGLGKN